MVKKNYPIVLLCIALFGFALPAYAIESDGVAVSFGGVSDSNGMSTPNSEILLRFAPAYFDAKLGNRIWEVHVGEDLDAKDFTINFDMRAREEDLKGGLSFAVPVKQAHTLRFGGHMVSRTSADLNEIYGVAQIGGDYTYDAREQFSFDIVHEYGRKQGTMFVIRNRQAKGEWQFVSGASVTSLGACGLYLRGQYKRTFLELAHTQQFDYHDFDRTSLHIGMQFKF